MTVIEYALGVFLIATAAISLGFGSAVVARALVGGPVTRATAVLTAAIVAVGSLLVAAELLGSIGGFRRWPLFVTIVGIGVAMWLYGRRRTAAVRRPPRDDKIPVGIVGTTAAAVALGVAPFIGKVLDAYAGGMREYDTLWYHMPFAARFVQEGWVTGLHAVGNPTDTFLPARSELLHGFGILAFGTDLISPLVNVGWLGLALLAAWCIGRPFGVAPATVVAASLVLFVPVMYESQGGSAKNDLVGLALLLAAAAFAVDAQGGRAGIALSAATAGLAFGVKPNFILPAVALAAAVVLWLAPAPRHRLALTAAVAFTATGAFWHLRNLIVAGNPFPWFGFEFGGVTVPSVSATLDCGTTTVAGYADDPSFVRENLYPLVPLALGDAWLLVVAVAVAGAALGLALGPGPARVLGAVAVVSAIAYLVTPGGAGGEAGRCFYYNTRFAQPALLLGAVALPIALSRFSARGWIVVPLAAAVVLNVPHFPLRLVQGFVAGVVLAGAVWAIRRRIVTRRTLVAAAAVAAVLAVGLGWLRQDDYLRDRYAKGGLPEPLGPSYLRLRDVDGARIAVGNLLAHYPLYGVELENHVAVPATGSGVDLAPITTCAEWHRALADGDYDYVVALAENGAEPREARWTRRFAGATEILRSDGNFLFRLEDRGLERGGSC